MQIRRVRIIVILIALPLVLGLVLAGAFLVSHRTNGSLISSGERRTYLLYVPESYDPATPTPLVISIHGYAEWPAHQARTSRWNDLADEVGFVVVYPSGTGFPMRWSAFGARTTTGDAPTGDVAFIAALIDRLSEEYTIDPDRIYVNGLSNGGGMSFALTCGLSDRIAAFGSVAGAHLLPWEACRPTRPVPAILFHGTEDPIVPYEGGPSRAFDLPFPNVPAWVDELARRNGCSGPPRDLPDSGVVKGIAYRDCAADVVFYTIAGGGHSWPGGVPLPEVIAGTTTQDIDATRVMWAFFEGIR
jgi:polyhydroxybutyrate depolymerase